MKYSSFRDNDEQSQRILTCWIPGESKNREKAGKDCYDRCLHSWVIPE